MGHQLIGHVEQASSCNRHAVRAVGAGEDIIVLANRQPFRHDYDSQGLVVARGAHSGVVHAVEPLLAACSGVWVAHGAGTADRATVNDRDCVQVPPGNPSYRLRRVWLDRAEEQGYYDGFANEGLWPLCHHAYIKPIFRTEDFAAYRSVNDRFAAAVCDEASSASPLVLVQDYHFALAPQLVRLRLPRSVIVTFWHIPWPSWLDFRVCPWAEALLTGLLGSNIVGFQTMTDGDQFVETVERLMCAQVDRHERRIIFNGRRIPVRAYPASIEWPSRWSDSSPSVETCRRHVRHALGLPSHVRLGVGVDRLDYTKGLEEKLLAIERLLDRYPETRGSFAFVQLAQPTRARLPAYRDLHQRVIALVERINERFAGGDCRPVTLLEADHEPRGVFQYLRAADLCYVASLQDGMNLVSKEFVSAREDGRGVLILSRFAGSASELADALIVNPWDIDGVADTLARALRMTESEERRRMRNLRLHVARFSADHWSEQILADAASLRCSGEHVGSRGAQVGSADRTRRRRIVTFADRRIHAGS